MPHMEQELKDIQETNIIHVSSNSSVCIFKGDVILFTLSRKWAIIFLFT
jgi:hypothetical protein